jgi:hypothetical protein
MRRWLKIQNSLEKGKKRQPANMVILPSENWISPVNGG